MNNGYNTLTINVLSYIVLDSMGRARTILLTSILEQRTRYDSPMTARMGNEADAAGMTKGMRLTAANGGMVRCMIFIAIRAKATVTVSATDKGSDMRSRKTIRPIVPHAAVSAVVTIMRRGCRRSLFPG